jgi:hypothetical protein
MTIDYKKQTPFMPRFISREGFFVLWQSGDSSYEIHDRGKRMQELNNVSFESAMEIFNTLKSKS